MKQQSDYLASKNINPEERKKIAEKGNELKKAIGALENAVHQGKPNGTQQGKKKLKFLKSFENFPKLVKILKFCKSGV